MKFTNKENIPLPLVVWLLHDEYDYVDDPNYISATSLLKTTRQIVLADSLPEEAKIIDVNDLVASSLGTALHGSIEHAWLSGAYKRLTLLGYPKEVIERILINPTEEELKKSDDPIPVYMEQREIKEFMGYKIGGKYDLVADGILHDYKSTSAYAWLFGTNDDRHRIQGSIYRWLSPRVITEDFIRVCYIFTDWSKAKAKADPKYPQKRLEQKDIKLMSLGETAEWIRKRLETIEKNLDLPEPEVEECSDEELWWPKPSFRYFSDPTKTTGRASRVFDNAPEAYAHKNKQNKGIVIVERGKPNRCGYCPVYDICTQKDKYFP